uniref:Cupin type-1 domain-containing protein n=1 Tax=Salix viminalis TaxID=40686 RepID=A0A6N2LP09_SALVM
MNSLKPISSFLFVPAFVIAQNVLASDPDILSDFIAATNTRVDGKFFTFTEVRGVLTKFPQNFTLTKATLNEFPALNGQSVSYAVLQFPADGLNPPLVLLNSCS